MRMVRRAAIGAAAFALVTGPSTAAAATEEEAPDDAVTVVAGGLDGPRQVDDAADGLLVIAESDTGEVSSVDPDSGEVVPLVSGLVNPQGVGSRYGELWIAVGEAGPPEVGAPLPPEPPAVGQGGTGVLVTDADGAVLQVIDTLEYELANNPDGQVQLVDGGLVDSLSNPFAVLVQRNRVLVADAGANAVLSVDRDSGEVSTFFVPPVVTPEEVPACAETPNNPGTVGCDPVPTGVVRGPDGHVYVSTLGSEVPGAARVYELSSDGEEVVDVHGDLTDATGVAVDEDGTVYVSDLLEGLPAGEPGPDFDPATVGQVVRIDPDGTRTTAQVTMPTGLLLEGGDLYASTWSIAGLLGIPGRGEVVRIGDDVFA
jgi:outer membrane protein assembly factor BamB